MTPADARIAAAKRDAEEPKPTPGAMRAAERICEKCMDYDNRRPSIIAKIIDTETDAPGFLKAAKEAERCFRKQPRNDGDIRAEINCLSNLRAAIVKAETP